MDLVQSILLHTMWVVHLFFQRLLSNRCNTIKSNDLPLGSTIATSEIEKSPRLPKLPAVIKDIIDFDSHASRRHSRMRRGHTISHFLFDEKKTGLLDIDMSDIVSPLEEEMLRWLCAKGVETKQKMQSRLKNTSNSALTKACSEMCIPRDIFTNVWLNSYLTNPSQA